MYIYIWYIVSIYFLIVCIYYLYYVFVSCYTINGYRFGPRPEIKVK